MRPTDDPIDRCRQEIAAIEALIRSGHPELPGLCLELADWSAELRILLTGNKPAVLNLAAKPIIP